MNRTGSKAYAFAFQDHKGVWHNPPGVVSVVGSADKSLRSEMMDAVTLPLADTHQALADLERVNRWLLGLGASRRALLPRIVEGPRHQTLIDLGTGSGQVPHHLASAAARRGVSLRVVGIDRKLSHLLYGRSQCIPQLRVVADADALPVRDGAAHWSFSNLFFHHFTSVSNRPILLEMRRVARRAAVVVDLRRAVLARALVRLLLPLLRVGPVARYDGWLSADQAWAMQEVAALAADHQVVELQRRFPFRFSLVLAAG